MVDFLVSLDINILRFFNSTLDSQALTSFFSTITNAHKMWQVQVGLLLLIAWVAFHKRSKVFKFIFALFITAGLSDAIAYHGIKKSSFRLRPHHVVGLDVKLKPPYKRKTGGPKSSSFPSNHAMTSFALAHTVTFYFPVVGPVVYGLAGTIALSRVYLGVHYPSDIIAGAALGLLLSLILVKLLYRKFFRI